MFGPDRSVPVKILALPHKPMKFAVRIRDRAARYFGWEETYGFIPHLTRSDFRVDEDVHFTLITLHADRGDFMRHKL